MTDNSINKGLILSMGVALVIQAGGFIWWMSGLNSEVQRLSSIQGTAIPALQAEFQKSRGRNPGRLYELNFADIVSVDVSAHTGNKIDSPRLETQILFDYPVHGVAFDTGIQVLSPGHTYLVRPAIGATEGTTVPEITYYGNALN